jgi:hypothetical protein
MKWFLSIALLLLLGGCGGMNIPNEKIINANYGSMPSYEEAIESTKKYLDKILIDPESLRLDCSDQIRKGWARDNMYDEPIFGYLIRCDVNSKNSFGGYTGNKDYVFVINGSKALFGLEVSRNRNTAVVWNKYFMGYTE